MAIKKAETECKVARIQTILKASEKSWQAAAWWLERRCPEEYGRTVKEEKPQNVVTIEELEEVGRLQDAERYETIEEARAAWAKEEEAEKRSGDFMYALRATLPNGSPSCLSCEQ